MNKLRTCVVCIAKNEDRTIQEWLDYNIKLGFDKIFIYQNDWTCNIEQDYLTKLHSNGKNILPQVYNNWLSSKYRNDFDWAAIIDCDEFIVLHKHKTISEFLSEFDADDTAGISPNWFFFGSGGQESPSPNPESLIKRFTFRDKNPNIHVKTIINLKIKSAMVNPHSPNKPTIDTNRKKFSGPFNPNGPTDIIQINHYYHKSKQEWIERLNRGQADACKRTMDMWDKTINSYRDVEDLTALNFLYPKL
jgi:hypothetical protein